LDSEQTYAEALVIVWDGEERDIVLDEERDSVLGDAAPLLSLIGKSC
jgi:hypothetical protein